MMNKQFIESNIVLLGTFKPPTYDKLFFIKHALVEDTDFLDSSIFTPEFSHIETSNFKIDVNKNKIVIVKKLKNDIVPVVESMISEGDAAIKAIGINFKWLLFVEGSLSDYTKSLFYSPLNANINSYFDSKDVKYGYYVSKDYEDSRMKLDIKPMNVTNVETQESKDVLSFDFNFHIDNNSTKEELKNNVKKYGGFLALSEEIISSYE